MPPKKRRATTSTRTTKQSKARKMPDSSSRPSTRATRPVKKKQPPRPIPAACATTPPQPLDEREGSVINPQPGASVVGASVVTFSDFSAAGRSDAYPASPRNLASLSQEANRLFQASVAPKTRQTYNTAYEIFNQFRYHLQLPVIWPAPLEHIVQFLAYLSLKGRSPSSLRTYISGLSHIFKIQGMADNTKSFMVAKILEGANRLAGKRDIRAPITYRILLKIITALVNVCSSSYETLLFQATFSLAFFGFMRVGELTMQSLKSTSPSPLQRRNIELVTLNGQPKVKLTIRQSKTDQLGKSCTLFISKTGDVACPVAAISKYLAIRNPALPLNSPFLIHFDGNPLTRYQFAALVAKALSFCEISTACFKSHSFRIGAATEAAMRGI
ncbi:uncharacterized protein LOC130048715 [Ostrea edulis]|uniref:uncharacterized protein LOC130048715 n=1 Tax=Ostrea edulis TaxID=37623 RepID=UPI0024AF90C0|nr:uncharacterized protein LOC130048715 [Ostrea edulis]